jgi:hypothetical protein
MDSHSATEVYDGRINVLVLHDTKPSEKLDCASYSEAIETVKQHTDEGTVAKIEDRDGEIVFTSERMDIEDWEREWKNAKRRLSVDVEAHECPYDSKSCFSDDLCVQCKMDAVQDRY